jgi:hypothetical protein
VGSEVGWDKDYSGGAVQDARRDAGRGAQGVTQVFGRGGETQVAGPKARCKSRDARHWRIVGRKARRKSRDARHGRTARRELWDARGVDSLSDEPPFGSVKGQEEGERREGLEEVPADVAQTGPLSIGKGLREGGDHPRCTDGHTPTGGSGGRKG